MQIKIIPQPYSSGSSSDGEDTHQSHDCNAKQQVELKVKLKLDKAVVHTSCKPHVYREQWWERNGDLAMKGGDGVGGN